MVAVEDGEAEADLVLCGPVGGGTVWVVVVVMGSPSLDAGTSTLLRVLHCPHRFVPHVWAISRVV